MTKYTAPNPYDCQNPVTDHRLFAGRDLELRELSYYIEQARVTRPTNLAFIGTRGSGKTSLLFMAAHYAREADLAVVDIRFNETHATSQVAFFFHLFDSLINTVFGLKRPDGEELCFGGKGGLAYSAYIAAAYAYEKVDPEALGFLFPMSYAAAMSKGRTDFVLSDAQISEDLRRIHREVGRPILLLLDECNVVVSRRDILQCLRNIFQDQPGYMTIVAGTESLFPIIDEVFSPVGRGFKQIRVDAYTRPIDTYECMLAPLTAAKLDPSLIDSFKPTNSESIRGSLSPVPHELLPDDLVDLHTFTSGSPLEIRRACHFMYRDMQLHGRKSMRMTSGVLEAVLQDLASSSERRQLLERLKKLRGLDLDIVSILSCFGRHLSLQTAYDLLAFKAVLQQTAVTPLSEIRSITEELERKELVVVDTSTDSMRWVAGDLECILAKYVTRAANLPAGNFPERYEGQLGLVGILLRSKMFDAFGEVDEVFGLRNWRPWFREDTDSSALHQLLDVSAADFGCFGKHLTISLSVVDSEFTSVSGWRWMRKIEERLHESRCSNLRVLEDIVARTSDALTEATDRFGVHLEAQWHDPLPPVFSSAAHARDLCSRPHNRSSFTWISLLHGEVCSHFLEHGPTDSIAAGISELVAPREADSSDFDPCLLMPNLGFIALACGLPASRGFFERLIETRRRGSDADGLMFYNSALSCLTCEPPDVDRAATELSSLLTNVEALQSTDRNGVQALLRVERHGVNDLRFVLWKSAEPYTGATEVADGEPRTSRGDTGRRDCPGLADFVRQSLNAVEAVKSSTSDIRVLSLFVARNP